MNNFKNNFKSNYTQVPNEVLNDKELSLKAKGLLVYLISKDDTWNFSAKGINSQNKEGLTSINSGLKELESLNYLERKKIKYDNGQFKGIVYIIQNRFNLKSNNAKPINVKPVCAKPINGESINGKPTNISNTILSNTKLSNNNISNIETEVSLKNTNNIDLDIKKEKEETKAQKTIREKKEFIEALEMNGAFKDYAEEYVNYRLGKKLSLSKIVLNKFLRESNGLNINEVIEICMSKSWKGFERKWYDNLKNENNGKQQNNESDPKIGRTSLSTLERVYRQMLDD